MAIETRVREWNGEVSAREVEQSYTEVQGAIEEEILRRESDREILSELDKEGDSNRSGLPSISLEDFVPHGPDVQEIFPISNPKPEPQPKGEDEPETQASQDMARKFLPFVVLGLALFTLLK